MLYSSFVERALRFAAAKHHEHVRKGSEIPYLTHLAGVTLILARAGFDDDEVLAAALLHDAVEDAGVTHAEIASQFTPRVAKLVAAVSEVKHDEAGVMLPWRTRKEEHLTRLRAEPVEARAIALADKLHNLGSLVDDLATHPEFWSHFNAPPDEQLWYYEAIAKAIGDGAQLDRLRHEVETLLDRLRELVGAT